MQLLVRKSSWFQIINVLGKLKGEYPDSVSFIMQFHAAIYWIPYQYRDGFIDTDH